MPGVSSKQELQRAGERLTAKSPNDAMVLLGDNWTWPLGEPLEVRYD